jgi:hypothetical protein
MVNPGVVAVGNVAAATDVIELSTGTFLNANAVVQALHSATNYLVNWTATAGLAANDSEHVIVVYGVTGGGVNVMDLAITDTAAVAAGGILASNAATVNLHGSDMVSLTGVALASITAANFHFN